MSSTEMHGVRVGSGKCSPHPTASVDYIRPPRVTRLQARLTDDGIDVVVCFKPEHSFYITGFSPIIYSQPMIAILTPNHEPIMLVHALRDEHSRSSSWVRDIRLFGAWGDKKTAGADWQTALTSILHELGVADKKIGVEEEFISITCRRQLEDMLPKAEFVDVSQLIERCRLTKDPDEVLHARVAARIADVGMEAAIAALREGGTERDVCVTAMHEMNKFWAGRYPNVEVCDFGSFEGGVHNGLWVWALSGPRTFLNCDNPTQRRPLRGETVSLLSWTVANGMHAEIERTVAIGPLPDVSKRALDIILEIREEVDELMKPGTPWRDLFEKTRERLESLGYGTHTPGRIGHSIGLGAHERASIDAKSRLVLEPGMIVTLEPHIRIPSVCQTQISDTVLITDTGREYLTIATGGYIEI
ncbi:MULTISPECIES: M24 family metallopeptidase [Paraburkholderia]|uniref:M24 family metallopeptidase n=1 Tax=Paraburkholderia TaxID=1822464 RepID=UPI001FE54512|nr:Xaa-Pro peptidase family protein [Paraburkholderia podalyriae]